ncbi:MAG: rhamnan synthesis F family protein [Legionella sp.]|nr:rhamnan synthesis F family protein [Legionella sp.]
MNRIAFYVFFEKKGIVRDYVTCYLQGLQTIVSKIIVIVNGELSTDGREKLNQIHHLEIIINKNTTNNLWAYKAGLEAQEKQLSVYDEIILTNSSCYGPIYPLNTMFDKMAMTDCDFWGLTHCSDNQENNQATWLQSDFIVCRKNIFLSDHWKSNWDKGFTAYFANLGYQYTAYCEKSSDHHDITTEAPDKLIIEHQCPILPKQTFGAEYNTFLHTGRGSASKKTFDYIQQHNLYNINYILDDLLATEHYAHIKNCLHLNYFLPSNTPSNNIITSSSVRPKIAVCFHVYYEDLLPNCFSYIKAMPDDADIYITTSKSELLPLIAQQCTIHHLESADVKLISARGRSESAFLVACSTFIFNYDYVCVAHDKRSPYHKPTVIGLEFGRHNLDALLKTKQYIKNIINVFESNPKLGLLTPIHVLFSYFREAYGTEWGDNYEQVTKLLDELNIDVPIDASVPPLMPAGGMFWCRPTCLKKLINKQWDYTDFPNEPLPVDGSLLHAIERAYPFVAQDAGYLTGCVSAVDDAEAHLTNISYLYRHAKINENKVKQELYQLSLTYKQKIKQTIKPIWQMAMYYVKLPLKILLEAYKTHDPRKTP